MPSLIRGTVRGLRGEPVAGARVYFVQAPVSIPDVAALTGADGKFTLAAPVPGTYVVDCAAEGYATAREEVLVRKAEEKVIELRLELV